MDMNYRGGMWEGGGGQDGVELGGEWDNCNSIINKYILKKKAMLLGSTTVCGLGLLLAARKRIANMRGLNVQANTVFL